MRYLDVTISLSLLNQISPFLSSISTFPSWQTTVHFSSACIQHPICSYLCVLLHFPSFSLLFVPSWKSLYYENLQKALPTLSLLPEETQRKKKEGKWEEKANCSRAPSFSLTNLLLLLLLPLLPTFLLFRYLSPSLLPLFSSLPFIPDIMLFCSSTIFA